MIVPTKYDAPGCKSTYGGSHEVVSNTWKISHCFCHNCHVEWFFVGIGIINRLSAPGYTRDQQGNLVVVRFMPDGRYELFFKNAQGENRTKGIYRLHPQSIETMPREGGSISYGYHRLDESTLEILEPDGTMLRMTRTDKLLKNQTRGMGQQMSGKRYGRDHLTAGVPRTIIFQRYTDRSEGAFSLLIPKGWFVEGGIVRVNPVSGGGATNAIAAKINFSVKKDQAGSVMIHWLPDMIYKDMRGLPAASMFPTGSNYMGMTVIPLMSAVQFLSQVVFPQVHPYASGAQILDQRPMPTVAQNYQQRMMMIIPNSGFTYDAGFITVAYQENGISFQEKMVAVIENWGRLGAGAWGNKETFLSTSTQRSTCRVGADNQNNERLRKIEYSMVCR